METILTQAFGQDAMQLATTEKRLLLLRLLARLAHEVRNPLSSLDIHVQLLQEDLGQLAPEVRARTAGRLETIRAELHRLEEIVENFLRLAGPSSLNLQPVELPRILARVCELLQPEASTRQIAMALEVEANLPALLADEGQLTQALLNLVLNAVQAVEAQGRISIRALRGGGDWLRVEVHDSGPGVPVENRTQIFEPYFTTKEGGTGLGLWIAQQIVVAHRGNIQVANAPAGGAVFTVQLPWRKQEESHG